MKVYLVCCYSDNGESYEDAYTNDEILCVKATKELAVNYIKNLNPTEKYDDEEWGEKWGTISDELLNDGKKREVHIGKMIRLYAEDGNTIIGYKDLIVNGSPNYGDEWYLTYEVSEYELEES